MSKNAAKYMPIRYLGELPFELELERALYDGRHTRLKLLRELTAEYNAATNKEDRYRLGTKVYMVVGALKYQRRDDNL